ncbi:ubiquinone/menaquinone biosynthesis C-methylase UbiE [Aliiruegeria haliotis]|uniref:Ubiquinone/menaquinone biosynthesis C-methylase UbiE n=1 Tax=Aliiruegeria haliotis TaxID=1280846 RepID=A0A2T0RPU7_9RHOB|nr:class I SAM-dependent methyltransferase [Aliiruegeria haliotis]PRY23113.1 ubiquinone/menaquinone biosynthesis C-methylase UbiE [Aliiruegeria haliotis]
MAERAGFWNFIAKRYARTPVADEASYREKLRLTQAHLKPDWKLFELGCGTGSTAIEHAPLVKHIHAMDISPKMLDIARSKAEAAGIANITWELSGFAACSVPDDHFDAVLAMSILHLLDDPPAAAAKVYRMLKPGGVFFSSTVCLGEIDGVFKRLLPIGSALRVLPSVRDLMPADVERIITGAGFELETVWQPGSKKAVFIIARKPA